MKITPFPVLEQHARNQYRARFASAPEPKVINARALATLDAPRCFVWGGVTYWAPPLSYESGVRLMVAREAIRETMKTANTVVQTEVARTAATLIRKVLDRRRRPLWRLWSGAFFHDPPEILAELIDFLLYVEDQSSHVPSDRPVTVDLIDNLYSFQAQYGRRPSTWKDYVYGMRHIARLSSREDLRGAAFTRVGVNADQKSWREYEREMRAAAGWN